MMKKMFLSLLVIAIIAISCMSSVNAYTGSDAYLTLYLKQDDTLTFHYHCYPQIKVNDEVVFDAREYGQIPTFTGSNIEKTMIDHGLIIKEYKLAKPIVTSTVGTCTYVDTFHTGGFGLYSHKLHFTAIVNK
jgi:hypothetical protein